MELTFYQEEASWGFRNMDEIHVNLLYHISDDANRDEDVEISQRLFPKAFEASENHEAWEKDWREYIVPDLSSEFEDHLDEVLADLNLLELQIDEVHPDVQCYELKIPVEHGQAWYSSLNQARLALEVRYHFSLLKEDLDWENMPEVDEEEEPAVTERLTAYMRYEFYALIQEWLLTYVLTID